MFKKTVCFLLIVFFIFTATSFTPKVKPAFAIKTVVIDAGHGGKDPGCHGSLYKEKDIALAVALKLGKYIEDNMKDVKVIYTRKTDVFVELQERAMIANRAKADLFICVHCNSACVRDKVKKKDICRDQVHGAETYVMGIKNEKGKLDVAKRENASILLEDDYVKKYDGFDPNSDESYIIMSMFNDTYLNQSLSFAAKAQKQYATKAGRDDHGVKRASLWVLWRTYMPSVLTEIGYLTNKREELFLGSEKGQDYIAAGLFRAFREYKDDLEGTTKKYNDDIENREPYHLTKEDSLDMIAAAVQLPAEDTATAETETISNKKEDAKEEIIITPKAEEKPKPVTEKMKETKTLPLTDKNKDDRKEIAVDRKKESKAQPKTTTKETKTVSVSNRKENKTMPIVDKQQDEEKETTAVQKPEIDKTNKITEPKKEMAAENKKPETGKINKITEPKKEEEPVKKETPAVKKETEPISDAPVIYKVQFLSSDKKLSLTSDKFKGVEKPSEYMDKGTYKYTAGEFNTKKEAAALQNEMRNNGFKDAFVISMQDGKRIPFK